MLALEKWFREFLPLDKPLTQMRTAALEFTAALVFEPQAPRWLVMLGTSGAGKTMLAKLINRVFRAKLDGRIRSETAERVIRYGGGFIRWSKLVGHLREGNHRIFEDVADDFFVVLDDIGSEHPSEFINSKLFEFCSERERKWTVFTGNLSLQQIAERYDPRIASRMIRDGAIVVDVDVPDFNLRQAE